jgi:hypothetical protein
MVEPLGIARGDMAGDTFIKAEAREEAKSGSEAFFSMTALFGSSRKDGRSRHAVHEGAMNRRSDGRGWLRHESLREEESCRQELCLRARRLGRKK